MSTEKPDDTEVTAELLAHPLAIPAIATTMGLTMATQMLGFWMGAMSGAMKAGRRIADESAPIGGTVADTSSLPPMAKAPKEKAKPAVKAILKDAQDSAQKIQPVADAKPSLAKPAKRATTSTDQAGGDNVVPLKPVEKPKSADVPAAPVEQRPAAVDDLPGTSDDLKKISGIGPKLEQILNKIGVTTYAQIAAWTDSDVGRIEEHFGFPGRIGRDGWIGQATALAAGKAGA